MITKQNYFQKVKDLNLSSLTKALKQAYDYVKEATENHTSWAYYDAEKEIKQTIDSYFRALNEFLSSYSTSKVSEAEGRKCAIELIKENVKRGDSIESLKKGQMGVANGEFAANIQGNKIYVYEIKNKKVDFSFPLQSIYNEIADSTGERNTASKPTPKPKPKPTQPKPTIKKRPKKPSGKVQEVERIEDEVKFIKRYAIMNGKEKTDNQILSFISSLQKAILEKRIRKTSPFAKEITYIQTNLVKLHNMLVKIKDPEKRKAEIKIDKAVLEKFLSIGGSKRVRLSVSYLKRYIGIQGKNLTKEKAQRLIQLMRNAVKNKKLDSSDPYAKNLNEAFKSLDTFIKVAKKNDTLEVHEGVLNGINSALDGCCCESKKKVKTLNGIETSPEDRPQNTVMNSMDFSKLKFESLGFTGKWKELIGDPSEGFTAMVFGKPKMGKSYFCVDWAGYLARHHGDTLYVAKEEKLDATLQKKLNDKNVKHPCLFVSDHLPDDLSPYQFVFLDSVNKLGLTPKDLDGLKTQYPGKSFIDVHQTTKEGNFRGANEYQHDVDVVIEIPEKGKAVQFGRFNQGGEIEIF